MFKASPFFDDNGDPRDEFGLFCDSGGESGTYGWAYDDQSFTEPQAAELAGWANNALGHLAYNTLQAHHFTAIRAEANRIADQVEECEIRAAIKCLKQAREHLKRASAPRATDRVRLALSSAKGAERAAAGRRIRIQMKALS